MQTESTLRTLSHNDKEISNFLNELGDVNLESSHYLLLAAGPNRSAKKSFLSRVEKNRGKLKEMSLREIITQDEQEAYKNIDQLFDYIGETEKNLLFRHGDILAGEYTAFSYSTVRYATPQGKYFLNKIRNSETFIVIDMNDKDSTDKTLLRYAQAVVLFDEADSFFGKLKQITLNNHTFTNKRPALPTK